MNLFFFIFNLGLVVFIAALVGITPALNRKSLLFGVRVPEYAADLPESRRLKRSYIAVTATGCLAVLAAAVLQYVYAPDMTLLALLYFPFLMLGVQFAAFIPQWKKAKALKEQKAWVVPLTAAAETRSSADREKFSSLPWGWYIASAALVLAAAVGTIAVFPQVPDQIILHWGPDMQPDQWADKNLRDLLLMPLIALGTVAMMVGTNVIIYRQKLQVSAEHPALSFAQHKMYRGMMSHSLGFMTFCMALMFAALQLGSLNLFALPLWFIPAATIAPCVLGMLPVIYVPIRAGQSGCKLKPTVSPEDTLSESLSAQVKVAHPGRGDDQYWKLGMFYCNPEDPAVLIENRFGGNSGFNYARLPAKLFVAGIMALLIVSYAVITYFVLKYPLAW